MEPLNAGNAWVVSVSAAQRQLHAFSALLIALVVIGFALVVTPQLYEGTENQGSDDLLSAALSRAIFYLLVFLPLYMCAWLSWLWEKRAPIRAAFTGFKGFVLGAAVGGLLFLLAVLAASISGLLQERPVSAGEGLLLGVGLAALLTAFQAYGEELFFRGWLQPILATQWGVALGLLVTSALFAAAHCVTRGLGPIAVANIFLAGLLFGLMALRTGGLAAPFAAHGTWNWLEQSALGLLPNPGVDSLGSIVDVDLIGPTVLSGGADGLNGSLLVTAVLMIAVGAFLLPGLVKQERQVPVVEQHHAPPRRRV